MADPDIAGNNLLEYLQPDESAKTMYRYYMPDEWAETKFTIVARVKGTGDPAYDRVMDIQWRNGNSGTRDELRITPADSMIRLDKSDVEVKVDMDLSAWHTYRIVVEGDVASVYIDEAAEPAIQATTTSSTSDNYIKFGDESGDIIGGYLDWMVVWLGHEDPNLPDFVTGAPERQVYQKSGDAKLAELTTSVGELEPDFDPYTREYNLSVHFENPSVTLNAVANHDSATIEGAGEITEIPSIVNIVVTAEDGSQITYTVNVEYYYPSTDATLSALSSTRGELSPAFDPEVMEYDLELEEGTTSVLIGAEANDALATVEGDGLVTSFPNDVNIVVTAEDGTQLTYVVHVSILTGVNDISNGMFKAYPNPASDHVFINTGVSKSQLKVYNMAGSVIINRTINSGHRLDIGNLSPGAYLLKIENEVYTTQTKLVRK